MKNEEQRKIEKRLKELEKDSHPPVDWQELIHSNIERIEELEDANNQLMDIIKGLIDERRELKDRVGILEKIIEDIIPSE